MVYGRIGKLPDVPWHIGYTKKAENDPRRHKSRCIHYKCGTCTSICTAYCNMHCPGSAHCNAYKEAAPQFKESLKGEINRKKTQVKSLGNMFECSHDKAEQQKPRTSLRCGDSVHSKAYGRGEVLVVEIDNNHGYISVNFDGVIRKFTFDSANKYLTKEQNGNCRCS